jgi:putative transposase
MNEHRHEHTVTPMCWVLRVARAGFYAWLHEPVSDHAHEDARLLDLIRASYTASHGVYRSRRIFGDLREAGEACGLHRVERIVREKGIKPVRGYKRPRTITGRPSIIAPNRLERELDGSINAVSAAISAVVVARLG